MIILDIFGCLFLAHKNKAFKIFISLFANIQNLLNLYIVKIRSDNGIEFKYCEFSEFCDQNGISCEFSSTSMP